ncbi:hypothetical protein B0H15DRAFT_520736 [Mycena belliarum]|uniref:Uncharacterized protein n=1 Tax=Mycena belliarum TaxID=1033014 RepID=A0AAD6TYS3_9AGAR|nr:hypothetical protein B0H15DRAFT_520736 [Mycena belliae]
MECNSDRLGADINTINFGSSTPHTLQDCLNACSVWTTNNPRTPCLAVAWVPNIQQCNLKNPIPASRAPPPGVQVDSAVVTRLAGACPEDDLGFYTSSSGVSYQIDCDLDFPGYDIPNGHNPTLNVPTLRQCIEMCSNYNLNPDSTYPCGGVSYIYRSNDNSLACFLKFFFGGSQVRQTAYGVHSGVVKALPAAIRRRRGVVRESRWNQVTGRAEIIDLNDLLTDSPTTTTTETTTSSLYSLVVPTDDSKSPPGFNFDTSGLNDTQGQEDISDENDVPPTNTTSAPIDASSSNVTDTTPTNDYNGTLAQVWTIDKKSFLFNTKNGNLFLTDIANSPGNAGGGVDTSSMFQTNDAPTGMYADYSGRIFHVYEDELAAYNVSRIRLAEEEKVPLTSTFDDRPRLHSHRERRVV